MYLFDFHSKLRQLNPTLYVMTDNKKQVKGDWWTTGIYQKQGERIKKRISKGNLHYGNKFGGGDYLRKVYSGEIDSFIMGCPVGWVPEYTVFDLSQFEILAMGWRPILIRLAEKRLISVEKARKVFNCPSLGLSDYDLISTEDKIRRAMEE